MRQGSMNGKGAVFQVSDREDYILSDFQNQGEIEYETEKYEWKVSDLQTKSPCFADTNITNL